MITYVAIGSRQYGMVGGNVRRRPDWEFMAITRGGIAPVVEGRPPIERSSTLWVFPPEQAHDWIGAGEIAVAHATAVPSILQAAAEALAAQGGFIAVGLGSGDRRRVRSLMLELRRDVRGPDALSHLRQERAILELSLIAMGGLPPALLPNCRPQPQRVVDLAVAWFRQHLASGASITGAARAAGVSPAHLRRLFHDVLKSSPRSTLRELRLRRAEELLQDRGMRLQQAARLCGFADAPTLSRAFRTVRGRAPRRPRGH